MTTPGPELRIGDAEREAAVAALGEHYAAGRLTKEEYDERPARAYDARTRSALCAAVRRPARPVEPSRPAAPPAAETRSRRSGWAWGVPVVPVLLIALVVSILVGRPVILLRAAGLPGASGLCGPGAARAGGSHHGHGTTTRTGWR